MSFFDKIKRRGSMGLGDVYADCLAQNPFRAAVVTERKRSERSGKPFLLLLLDFTPFFTKSHRFDSSAEKIDLRTSFHKFIDILGISLRGIDVMGWYDKGKILGMIFPETDLSSKDALLNKVRAHLNFTLGESQSSLAQMHCFCFPANNTCDGDGAQTQNERDELYFYPDSCDGEISQMVSCGLKRLLDITGSLFGLILFLPFFIIIPILIKFDSDGPVFFRQKRVGFSGRNFTFLKFRSMYVGGDDSVHRDYVKRLIHDGAAAQNGGDNNESGAVYKITNDPRVTAVGRFLRRTSLDELPQFINVFLGQMSLVGPRPAIPYETQEYELWHRCRILDVKPGITGIWQVEGRSRTTFEEMVRMDMRYCRSKTFWLDLKLIFKTPFALIGARGAF